MVKHVGTVRPLLLGCALWSVTFLASAQNAPPEKESAPPSRGLFLVPGPGVVSGSASSTTEKSDKSTDDTVNLIGVMGPEQAEQLNQQVRQRQAKLREQLADPKQRAQVMSERIEQQRSSHRDLTALLRLDSRTEEKLFALLADQQLSQELQPPSFGTFGSRSEASDGRPYNPMRDQAAGYTQRMKEIAKIIGTARLDDYVDYQRKLSSRTYVSRFEAVLPAEGQLTFEQRNALTDLFHDQVYRTNLRPRGLGRLLPLDLNMSAEERNRQMQVQNIVGNERYATVIEAANRELVDRATTILTPEQAKALADWKDQELARQRAWTQAQRKALGIAPDEKLDDPEDEALPSPPISKNMRLTIDLTVNDTQVVKGLTSIRGGSVSFDAPEGLVVEVRPYMDEERLYTEIKLYEKVRGGRRMVGTMSGTAQLIDAGKVSGYGGSGGTMVQGRKGYTINWSVSGTYL